MTTNMTTNRRTALKALFAAPAAIPVAAKEAFGKIKFLGGVGIDRSMMNNTVEYDTEFTGSPISLQYYEEEVQRYKEQLASIDTLDWKHSQYRMLKHQVVRGLDPDLAALRSVSPSWAIDRQLERMVAIRGVQERNRYQHLISKAVYALQRFMEGK